MLLDYVENVVNRIITEKELNGVAPASASLYEIRKILNEDLLECMRQLHSEHRFNGIRQGVNSIPALVRF
jgi:hypothetical protein